MKKSIKLLSGLLMFIPIAIYSGCKDPDQKLETAQESVTIAKEELTEVKNDIRSDAQVALESAEWKAFKTEAEEKIAKNEVRISELRDNMKKSGKIMDSVYEQKIENLTQKNNELKNKISAYEEKQSNWETFKTEFNHDMNELGEAFKGLVENDK